MLIPDTKENQEKKEMGERSEKENTNELPKKKYIGMGAGLLIFILMVFISPPEGLSQEGWYTASIALLMAIWWTTEVIPIPVTAMLPLILFPLFKISNISVTATPYANPMIFLFMGGFILAIGMQEWNLHRRIALNIINFIGSKPRSIIFGFIVSTAFISMWVSNTAATMMMLPIALSVIELTRNIGNYSRDDHTYDNFAISLMLAIAFAANVGGLGTVIGTPTNALFIGFVSESYGIEISFMKWMLIGIPVVLLGLPLIFYALTYIAFPVRFKSIPGGKEYIGSEVKNLGKFSRGEIMTGLIFGFTAILWMTSPIIQKWLPGISDAGIAIFGALLLFFIPVNFKTGKFLLSWKSAAKLPWGILILFGGGLTLAGAIQRTGLAEWIGSYFTELDVLPFVVVIFIITTVVIMFTNLASNSATAAAFLPVMSSVAIGMGEDPLQLAIPVAIAASCAFMLPVGTPPNAIVYGSGTMTVSQMAKAGLWLNLLFVIIITLLTRYIFVFL